MEYNRCEPNAPPVKISRRFDRFIHKLSHLKHANCRLPGQFELAAAGTGNAHGICQRSEPTLTFYPEVVPAAKEGESGELSVDRLVRSAD